jgi:GNAT superfamily N-acetyltransferase
MSKLHEHTFVELNNKQGICHILKAVPDDMPDILKLQYEAYQSEALLYDNFAIQPLTQTLENALEEYYKGIVLKAEYNGGIIGSVRAQEMCGTDNTVYIGKLIVLPAYQDKGLGKSLLQAIENEYPGKRYELMTGSKSEKNLALYEKAGYLRFKEELLMPGLICVYLEKKAQLPD